MQEISLPGDRWAEKPKGRQWPTSGWAQQGVLVSAAPSGRVRRRRQPDGNAGPGVFTGLASRSSKRGGRVWWPLNVGGEVFKREKEGEKQPDLSLRCLPLSLTVEVTGWPWPEVSQTRSLKSTEGRIGSCHSEWIWGWTGALASQIPVGSMLMMVTSNHFPFCQATSTMSSHLDGGVQKICVL